MYTHT
jgi:exoribonuclease R